MSTAAVHSIAAGMVVHTGPMELINIPLCGLCLHALTHDTRLSSNKADIVQTRGDRHSIQMDVQSGFVATRAGDHRHHVADSRVVAGPQVY